MILTGCIVLPLRGLLVRATLNLLLFAFIYWASWDVRFLLGFAYLTWHEVPFPWRCWIVIRCILVGILNYCIAGGLFAFSHCLNSSHLAISWYITPYIYMFPNSNVISFAYNRMSWRAGNRTVRYVRSTTSDITALIAQDRHGVYDRDCAQYQNLLISTAYICMNAGWF